MNERTNKRTGWKSDEYANAEERFNQRARWLLGFCSDVRLDRMVTVLSKSSSPNKMPLVH